MKPKPFALPKLRDVETVVSQVDRFLDQAGPENEVPDLENAAKAHGAQIRQVFDIAKDVAFDVCRAVLSLPAGAPNRDLIEALAPLGVQPGWPFLGQRQPHRVLSFLTQARLASEAAMARGTPSMPLFAMAQSGSSYSTVVLEELMGVPAAVVSLWHFPAYRPWLHYLAQYPIPLHDHMPAHVFNLGELKDAGIERVAVQVRDPRQLILSLVRHSKQRGGHDVDISDESVANLSGAYAKWIGQWRARTPAYGIKVHVVRFEDMVADGEGFFSSILDFFNAPAALYDRLPEAMARATAQNSSGRLNFRKGRVDEWKEVLTPEQIRIFASDCAEPFSGLYSFD